MLYQFSTDDLKRAKAALILYAMYRSRDKNSPLNGMETWNRCKTFMRAACLRSSTTAEFVDNFCQKAHIQSIKPKYLDTGEPVQVPGTFELIDSPDYKNYATQIIEDNELLPLFENESVYIIMLVRERIQRERMMEVEDDEEDEY